MGVPLSVPVAGSNFIPGGREAGPAVQEEALVRVVGSTMEYATPTCAFGRLREASAGLGPTTSV